MEDLGINAEELAYIWIYLNICEASSSKTINDPLENLLSEASA